MHSSWLFAAIERTCFRTPYQHGSPSVDVSNRSVEMKAFIKKHLEVSAANSYSLPCKVKEHDWRGAIYLPAKGTRREKFYAKLEGAAEFYEFRVGDSVRVCAPGDDPFRCLAECDVRWTEWMLRTGRLHARTKTILV